MNETRRAHIIVLGNQKGGTGKSTSAMHLIAALLQEGASVASIDLDSAQGTLTRYLENRARHVERTGAALPCPTHKAIGPSRLQHPTASVAAETAAVADSVDRLSARHDFLVIDTPGADTFLNRVGHSYADTLVTPINDSFVDLDVLGTVDPEDHEIVRPSHYAEMVFRVKMDKARRDRTRRTFDWIVMRNRGAQLESRNQRAVELAMERLSARIGFRIAPGFSERVIFRELFLEGLTLLDLSDRDLGVKMTLSHVAARQEVRDLMTAIGIVEEIDEADPHAALAANGMTRHA